MNRELSETAFGITPKGLTKARRLRRKERILSEWSSKQKDFDLLSHMCAPTEEQNESLADNVEEESDDRARHEQRGNLEHSTMLEGMVAGTASNAACASPVAADAPMMIPNESDGDSQVVRKLELLQQQLLGVDTVLGAHGITPDTWKSAEKMIKDEHAQRTRDTIVLIKMRKVRKQRNCKPKILILRYPRSSPRCE